MHALAGRVTHRNALMYAFGIDAGFEGFEDENVDDDNAAKIIRLRNAIKDTLDAPIFEMLAT